MATHQQLFPTFSKRSQLRQLLQLVSMFFKWADPSDTSLGFVCLPYISGLTEPLTRLLRKNDIRVVSKPAKTLQQEFPSPKFRQPLDLQCNVVYKIPCSDCCWSYIGETGRCLKTRRKEHQQNLKHYTRGSNIANYAWQNNHSSDRQRQLPCPKNTRILAYCQNCRRRQ